MDIDDLIMRLQQIRDAHIAQGPIELWVISSESGKGGPVKTVAFEEDFDKNRVLLED